LPLPCPMTPAGAASIFVSPGSGDQTMSGPKRDFAENLARIGPNHHAPNPKPGCRPARLRDQLQFLSGKEFSLRGH
jgi:hypothetical protein